ncbi:hypothetical protein AKJ09_06668 [Labilithrix luteola]|uniref:Uncharacterized protein n=1 Tax=Labilithrix luteola TaxID=1391654 RepID=A0A0K1Q3N9_9BACT|nr:hypothetical protein [Labilithrix luteola]AKV00005.1 hypothetical protein AKJ09_06668 [Labilithrix luteola]
MTRALFVGSVVLLAPGALGCSCSKRSEQGADASSEVAPSSSTEAPRAGSFDPYRYSAPIAASRLSNGEVLVAGLDVAAKAIRLQRISAKDEIVADKTVLDGIRWSPEVDLKVAPVGPGVALTWRGKRNDKLVRQMLLVGQDLAPASEVADVAAGSCTTRDAVWFTDGRKVSSKPWSGPVHRVTLVKDDDATLVCGNHRAFALLDEDEGIALWTLGGEASTDAGAPETGKDAGTHGPRLGAHGPLPLLPDKDFGDDELRERAEYTVGDDLGVVRVASSGAVAIREVKDGSPGALRRLETKIPHDDDVVAVDASPRAVVIVFTEDASEGCGADGGAPTARTKVMAMRVDRTQGKPDEVVELSPGTCGREVGPFFTGVLGDDVSVAWVERVSAIGKARAPIAGLAHRVVTPEGALPALGMADQPADALVDAGCDSSKCFAVALARKPGEGNMVPGYARVIRYP